MLQYFTAQHKQYNITIKYDMKKKIFEEEKEEEPKKMDALEFKLKSKYVTVKVQLLRTNQKFEIHQI